MVQSQTCVLRNISNTEIVLVAVGLRPYYLQKEITSAIVITYTSLSYGAEAAADIIYTTVSPLHRQQPNAFMMIKACSHHNYVRLDKSVPTFPHYVDCPTQGDKLTNIVC